jgi:hypothetical protein
MLAGLLFAIHDADDRPAMLTATLPFGGVTLIEYQARLLIGAGASQLVIVVSRLTPELLGAINRIGRRGVAVDTVRSAAEAHEKLHPLAKLVMLADGLTTSLEVVAVMAREGNDALLVLPEQEAGSIYERVGGNTSWAGVARLDPRRIAELAALPRDYDMQSTLVRLASQARAVHIMLPDSAVASGHGIGHGAAMLEGRSRSVMAAMVSGRNGWFERFVTAPLARAVIPLLVPRAVPTLAIGAAAGGVGLVGLLLLAFSFPVAGLLLALLGAIGFTLGAMLGDLRDEPGPSAGLRVAEAALPALAALLYAHGEAQRLGDAVPTLLALVLVAIGGLAERALGGVPRRLWWGSAVAYLLLLWLGALLFAPYLGLGMACIYATATLYAAIERLRSRR